MPDQLRPRLHPGVYAFVTVAPGETGDFDAVAMAETDLDLVGLTATVSGRLAEAGIACNVIAGARHDHLFVPAERGEEAMGLLAGDG